MGQCSGEKGPGKGQSPLAFWPDGRVNGCGSQREAAHLSGGTGVPLRTLPVPKRTPVCMHGEETSLPRRGALGFLNSSGDEAPFTSGVPHHTLLALARPAPLPSHTPTPVGSLVKGGDLGRGADDNWGEAADSSQY